jgi:hypothetical protein
MSLMQLSACTWGRFDPSVSEARAGDMEMSRNSVMMSANEGLSALAERIPTTRAGIPAERLVVDVCEKMHSRAPLYHLKSRDSSSTLTGA